ncbi:RagB/SusD family nutrient uptake outer membrane protein [Pedobacter polaris]|uniref:RagB/SusD family nutrient uptake outer membrane protein n=1 Tax=Pedobacter polaris TaxID=2571273 RepID=A0A4U1CPB0_9SPHI|nr:RagB/SusD family nutrient uptake outer membrane protein [Pedobacter polaris]TKC09887.1 RagB/SusD family nutrient uptake outer membrane protein [Pedobacter polaris]
MRKQLYIYTAICCLVSFASCKKLLDAPPVSSITNESYWKAEGDVTGYMTGINADFRNLMNTTLYFEDRSDVFVLGLEGATSTAWAQNLTSLNAPNWINFYNLIHHCNLVIKYAPTITTGTAANINRALAQAYFIRAHTYFSLIRTWGNVPIVLQPTESAETELPARSPATEVMALILSDIEQSLKNFPENGFVNKNKVSKPAANALKADVLLWKNKVLSGTNADLEGAIAAADLALGAGVSIISDFSKVHATDNRKNAEIIFAFYFLRDEKSDQYGSRLKPRDIFVAAATNVAQLPFSKNGARSVYAPSAKIQSLFASNDVRKANSFIAAVDASNNITGVFDNKFRGTLYPDDRYYENEIVLYRAAEMILFKAEALAALNRIPEAKTELDKVRGRAGIGPYNGPMDKISFEKELLNERAREFWLELKRWPDLVRFHFGGTINVYNEVPNLLGKSIPLFSPIPNTQIFLNPNLKQTEGYAN